jgi:hypothetical protein
MPNRDSIPVVRRPSLSNARLTLLSTGAIIYLLSFFCPAVSLGESNGMVQSGRLLPGWTCAYLALRLGTTALSSPPGLILLLAGLLNPLTVGSAALSLGQNRSSMRGAVACSVPICLVSAWMFLAFTHSAVHIGHVLWVVGIVLIVGPEIVSTFSVLFQDPIRRRS